MRDKFIQKIFERNAKSYSGFPDKNAVAAFIDQLFEFLFLPNNIHQKNVWMLVKEYDALEDSFAQLLLGFIFSEEKIVSIAKNYFSNIPVLFDQLIKDAELILQFDPAAESLEEVFVAYPGFYATSIYRLSHQLTKYEVPILPRLFSEYAHSKTGIDIHPAAVIGHPFFIDHGTGIVIGETSVIGNNVKIYQGVTLGAMSVAKELTKIKRHPTIEDNVIIYAGATILGGDTVVGSDSVIGGNVWLTNSVPPNSVVYHKSEVTIKDMLPQDDIILNFVI